jgi:DNA-binding beta-propeller fold protein YncE
MPNPNAAGGSGSPKILAIVLAGVAVWSAVVAGDAFAGPPKHLSLSVAAGLSGFDHPCGVATDSAGDVYVASAGDGEIRIFNPAHTELTSIENTNEPCGLAVNSEGELFVFEQGTGKVVRYKPNVYPFSSTPSYGAADAIDSTGNAKGIAIDPVDGRLYVAEGNRIAVYESDGTFSAADEVQKLLVQEATGGTYTLSFNEQQTGPLPYNAPAAEIKAALSSLSTIGPGNVEVEQVAVEPERFIYHVTFVNALRETNVPNLVGDKAGLTGGGGQIARVDELTKGFNGHIGEGTLNDATGVSAYTYKLEGANVDRYLFVADAATNRVIRFGGTDFRELKFRGEISEPKAGEGFGFGPAGAYLAVDPGNANANGKCVPVSEQACTAGHLLVYDKAHDAIDEFEADGEFLDQFSTPGLEDAEPTALAIERSGGPNDGDIYITSGAGPGGSVLAFSPLAAPSRKPLPALSRKLPGAGAIATDCRGNVYVVAGGGKIHVFSPTGTEIEVGSEGDGIADENNPGALAVDCAGNVYVVDKFGTAEDEPPEVPYYAPSAYPPTDGTTYVRHAPVVTLATPGFEARASDVAVNPVNDRVVVLGRRLASFSSVIGEFRSAEEGSGFIRLLEGTSGAAPPSVDFYGFGSNAYVNKAQGDLISVTHDDPLEPAEGLARISEAGCPSAVGSASKIAVDQSNGHVLVFSPSIAAGREYDASGACVAEFYFPEPQRFGTTGLTFDIAIDNACAIHRNDAGEVEPLDETTTPTCAEFDPASGNAYIAYDDPKPASPDLWAFGPLSYGEPPSPKTGVASAVGPDGATLDGSVDPRGFELENCVFEWGTTAAYGEAESCAESIEAIGNGSEPVPVHRDITGIDPQGTRYHFRLCVKNKFGEACGEDAIFGPPQVSAESARPILYDEATLRAQVDPSGLVTKYHFDYVDQQDFEAQGGFEGLPTRHSAEGDLAAGTPPSEVKTRVAGLAEGTTYRFRVVVENEAETAEDLSGAFTTLERRQSPPCPNNEYRTGASASLPDCRAYELVTPAETGGLSPFAAGTGNLGAGFDNWLVVPRGTGAGETLTYFTKGTLPGYEGNGVRDAYRAERAGGEGGHPVAGWSNRLAGPTYAQALPDLSHNIDVRGVSSDQLFSFWFLDPAFATAESLPTGTYLNTPSGFEAVGRGALGTDLEAASRYVSSGGDHVIFSSAADLEPAASPAGTQAIYDRAAGSNAAKVLSVPPPGATPATKEKFEEDDATFLGASEDGSAVAFAVGGALYLHRGGETTEVAPTYTAFDAISEDGERVFFTASGSLRVFEAGVTTLIATGASFIVSAADGSHAFFTSIEEGTRNLHVWDGTATSLVAALSPADSADLSAHTTPRGGVLVFRSHAQLSAYDNEGKAEIYRYDPAAAAESILCVSCDPSDAPPSGDAALRNEGGGLDVAASTRIPNVTDDGTRVFFESPDRLLPEDANDVTDVYEWTAKGGPDCTRTGGCLALISSGQGENGSHLYGMSADGRDVIFFTLEKLLGRDVPGSPSLYDAREGGGIPEAAAAKICTGDACQGEGSAPPALPAPTSTGLGGGNVEQTGKPTCPKGRRLVRRHGKVHCLKRHGHKARHHRTARKRRGHR